MWSSYCNDWIKYSEFQVLVFSLIYNLASCLSTQHFHHSSCQNFKVNFEDFLCSNQVSLLWINIKKDFSINLQSQAIAILCTAHKNWPKNTFLFLSVASQHGHQRPFRFTELARRRAVNLRSKNVYHWVVTRTTTCRLENETRVNSSTSTIQQFVSNCT